MGPDNYLIFFTCKAIKYSGTEFLVTIDCLLGHSFHR